ncbi:hypothetical protein [Leptolyngbya sp. KIOST-1]|uniref:hypothetical protein n=1 Tax=Leptolyngbya sp. KIOST-1 TaxID=1229172 RepID=UPI000AF75047|nr:hypothetical protein [Leptolyngbya sp. KIOST-1]
MVQLHPWRRWPQVLGLGGVALGALLFGCSPQPQVSNPEVSYEGQLAQHLTTTGGVMYGAYWCPHCADQLAMFQASVDRVPYVECAADGNNPQPELCKQRGIRGYPTWEIGGQLYPGVRSLDELANLSGFSPPP